MNYLKKTLLYVSLAVCMLAACAKDQMPVEQFLDSLMEKQYIGRMDSVEGAYREYHAAEQEAAKWRSKSGGPLKSTTLFSQEQLKAAEDANNKAFMLSNKSQNVRIDLIEDIMNILVQKGYTDSTEDPRLRDAVNYRILDALEKRMGIKVLGTK